MGIWPVCLLLFIIVSLKHETNSLSEAEVPKDSGRNVGTVLFDKSSLSDHCWTNEEFILLSSRKMFQDLLPKVDTLNIHSDEYVAGLLDYFNICIEKVSSSAVGKTRHLMMKAVADVMGGYLHSYLAPILKVSFYAGKVRFNNVQKIYLLLERMKSYLRTDGLGWKRPIELEMFINVTPIALVDRSGYDSCDQLVTRRSSSSRASSRHDFSTDGINGDTSDASSSALFLPYFDDDARPNSVALPFKDRTLWSLYDEASVDVLGRYYELSVGCVSSMDGNSKDALDGFNTDFYKWLIRSVYPRLGDDKFYPAFGGVLRIIVFLKKGVKIENDPTDLKPVLKFDEDEKRMSTVRMIIIAIVTAIVVWLLAGLCLTCYKLFRHHSDKCSACESYYSDASTSRRRSKPVYCAEGTCPCAANDEAGRSFSGAVKNWYKSRGKSDPGVTREKGGFSSGLKSQEDSLLECGSKRFIKIKKPGSASSSTFSTRSSSRTRFMNKKFHYSSDISSTSSDSYHR